jgi:hypothetical protein
MFLPITKRTTNFAIKLMCSPVLSTSTIRYSKPVNPVAMFPWCVYCGTLNVNNHAMFVLYGICENTYGINNNDVRFFVVDVDDCFLRMTYVLSAGRPEDTLT